MAAIAKLNLVIGDPITHSLSPLMHNHAYKVLGLSDQYYFGAARVTSQNLSAAIQAVRTLEINCLSVTLPHKQAVIEFIDELDPDAKQIGAVNTILNRQGKLFGTNTDLVGIIDPLKSRIDLKGTSVALLGAGGAARAAAYALVKSGAKVTIFNRNFERAQELKKYVGAEQAADLSKIHQLEKFKLIINATSVGLASADSILRSADFNSSQIVFDMVYTPLKTALLENAERAGCQIISGLEMFVAQGAKQLELATGHTAPRDEMYNVVRDYLTHKDQKI